MRLVVRPMAPCTGGCVHAAELADPPSSCDRRFVVSSWVSSFRRSPHAGLISMARWRGVMNVELEEILGRPGVRVLMLADATASEHLTDLLGHLVWQERPGAEPLIFFTFVKAPYRRQGLARLLLEHAGIDAAGPLAFACRTHASDRLIEDGKLPRAAWRPLLGRSPTNQRNDEREAED